MKSLSTFSAIFHHVAQTSDSARLFCRSRCLSHRVLHHHRCGCDHDRHASAVWCRHIQRGYMTLPDKRVVYLAVPSSASAQCDVIELTSGKRSDRSTSRCMLEYLIRKAHPCTLCMVCESHVPPLPRVNMLVDAAMPPYGSRVAYVRPYSR